MSRLALSAAALLAAAALIACDAGPVPTEPPAASYISSSGLVFDQPNVAAPADQAFQLYFENREGIPHNVAVLDEDGGTIAESPVITGPAGTVLEVPALAAAQYRLICQVHPETMKSILVAGAAT